MVSHWGDGENYVERLDDFVMAGLHSARCTRSHAGGDDHWPVRPATKGFNSAIAVEPPPGDPVNKMCIFFYSFARHSRRCEIPKRRLPEFPLL